MKDNLENFVHKNRAAFDEAVPSLKVWSAIDKQLARKPDSPKRSIVSIIRKIAAVLAIMGMGALMALYFLNNSTQIESKSIAELDPDYEEMEAYYQSQINRKVALLSSYEYDQSVKEDLGQLDEFLQELKLALDEAPKGKEEEIINAMINNYKTRMDILERVLNRVQTKDQKEQSQKEDHQTI